VVDSIACEGRVPLRPDGNDSMQSPVPPAPHTAAASRRTPCAAAAPPGASELAQRLECASLERCRTTALVLETFCPSSIFQARSTPDPIHWSADDIYPQRAGFHPGPGRINPN
jgi:hypothetical protein